MSRPRRATTPGVLPDCGGTAARLALAGCGVALAVMLAGCGAAGPPTAGAAGVAGDGGAGRDGRINGGGGRGGRERIEIWVMGREGEVLPELLPEFERRHPGLRVEVQQIPWTLAHEKLLTAFVGRSTPDVAVVGTTWVPELVAIGALAGLDDRLAAAGQALPASDYFPGSWDTGVIDGRVYSIPWYVDSRLLFYRSDLLAAAGCELPMRLWSGWRHCMERVKARAGPDAYAILLPTDEWEQPIILALQLGAPLLRDGGRYGAFSDPRVERALTFYVDLFARGLAPRVGDNQVPNAAQLFGQGHFAMFITGPWNLGEFRRRLPPALAGSWTTAPLPAPDEQEGQPGSQGKGTAGATVGASLAGGANLAIFRASRHQRAAWELIEYLSEPAQQARFYALVGDLPARRSAWQDPALAADPRALAFREQLQHAVAAPKVPEWEQIATRVYESVERAIRGLQSPHQALASLDRDVDQILEKRRWLLDHRAPPAVRRRGEGAGAVREPAR